VSVPSWIAAIVLFVQLPIPLFWFVVHPQVRFWRRHTAAGYLTGVLFAWGPVTAAMIIFRHELFRHDWPPLWRLLSGLALLIFEGWVFWRVEHDLGSARLVGKVELSGGGEVISKGIYARVRHPRYVGSFLAILGACLLAGKPAMWLAAGVWLILILIAIAFEEHELRSRFGPAYQEYCRRVPRFFPLRTKPRPS
jgi:protein-S-isoprenylcysteine O-methyltransferase Ste14